MKIEGFFNEFRFLSNFHPSEIIVDGITYPTVEHAYQALKCDNKDQRNKIAKTNTPGQAKRMGRGIQLRSNWDTIRVPIMHTLLEEKFKIPEFRDSLIMTYPHSLEETNNWNDQFWGVCNGAGENQLGKLLMKVRQAWIDGADRCIEDMKRDIRGSMFL